MTATGSVALDELEKRLAATTFVHGSSPSKDDAQIFERVKVIGQDILKKYPNVEKWLDFVTAFPNELRAKW